MTIVLLGTSSFAIPIAAALRSMRTARGSAPCATPVSPARGSVGPLSQGTPLCDPSIRSEQSSTATDATLPPSLGSNTESTLSGIITKPDKPASPPLAVWARDHGVRLWQPATKGELTALLQEQRPDVAVVAAYGKIIPPEALAIPRFGFVNVHPSLLPSYRGPSPMQAAIANGDAETGVTLIVLDADVDHGPIIAQERVTLSPTIARRALEGELAERGAALLARVLPEYLAGRIVPTPQDHARATVTPLLSRDDGRMDWNASAAAIERNVRAYEGWPGTWCVLPNAQRLKVLRAAVNGPTTAAPGSIVRSTPATRGSAPCATSVSPVRGSVGPLSQGTPLCDPSIRSEQSSTATDATLPPSLGSTSRFDVACGDGVLLTLVTVQGEGRTITDGASFLRGFHEPGALR